MGLVIDTNVFIYAEKGQLDLSTQSLFNQYEESFIAAVSVSELLASVQLAKTVDVRIRRSAFVEGIISKIPILDFNEDVARVYAEIYSYFIKPRSKKVGNLHDLQIAATAITYGYPVLTKNKVDFKKIPGLNVEVLR